MRAWLESLRRPVVVWSLCGAYAAVMLTLWLVPRSTPHGDVTVVWGRDTVSAPQVDHKPGTQVNAPAGGTITPIPNYGGPGKRRTTDQEQNKESLIGPEDKNSGNPEPPLRDL